MEGDGPKKWLNDQQTQGELFPSLHLFAFLLSKQK